MSQVLFTPKSNNAEKISRYFYELMTFNKNRYSNSNAKIPILSQELTLERKIKGVKCVLSKDLSGDTKLEFNFNGNIDILLNIFSKCDDNIELINLHLTQFLCRLYNYEKKNNKIKSFNEFVRKYKDYIYTEEILINLYTNSKLKSKYQHWFNNFQKRNSIYLCDNKLVLLLQEYIIKEITDRRI